MKLSDWQIEEGTRIPTGYGIAWVQLDRSSAVILPVPFHFLAGWLRRQWHEFVRGYRGDLSVQDTARREGFRRGKMCATNSAYLAGVAAGMRQYEKRISAMLDAKRPK